MPISSLDQSLKDKATTETGVIRESEIYTISEFKRRLDISDATLRKARRNGLPVYRCYRRCYVRGVDWVNHVIQAAAKKGAAVNA
jgi:hypothetical protein